MIYRLNVALQPNFCKTPCYAQVPGRRYSGFPFRLKFFFFVRPLWLHPWFAGQRAFLKIARRFWMHPFCKSVDLAKWVKNGKRLFAPAKLQGAVRGVNWLNSAREKHQHHLFIFCGSNRLYPLTISGQAGNFAKNRCRPCDWKRAFPDMVARFLRPLLHRAFSENKQVMLVFFSCWIEPVDLSHRPL